MANFVGEKFGVLGDKKYNSSAIIKAIREDLKKEFPQKIYKFGVRRNGAGSKCIQVLLKQVPKFELIDQDIDAETHLRYADQFKKEFINKITQIANAYNYDNSDIMSDYFDCNYYLDIKCIWWNTAKNTSELIKIV